MTLSQPTSPTRFIAPKHVVRMQTPLIECRVQAELSLANVSKSLGRLDLDQTIPGQRACFALRRSAKSLQLTVIGNAAAILCNNFAFLVAINRLHQST
jgi:hypothetical protein